MTGTKRLEPVPPPMEVREDVGRSNPPPRIEDVEALLERQMWEDSRVPAILCSLILHTLLLLLLALVHQRGGDGDGLLLTASQGESKSVVTFQMSEALDDQRHQDETFDEQPVVVTVLSTPQEVIASPLPISKTPQSETPDAQSLAASGGTSSETTAELVQLPGGGLAGRTPEGRKELGEKYGATAESERAVEAALKWLAAHQRASGGWSFDLTLDPCNGRCRNSKQSNGTPTPSTAATGLALLAFLGAGHTHLSPGPYRENVRRGLYFLRSAVREVEAGNDWQGGSMYGQGIALMSLAETLAMTAGDNPDESDWYELVAQGVRFTAIAQHESGSWGYVPGSPGDTTLTGWQVLSLVAAKRSGVPLRSHTLPKAKEFLLSTSEPNEYWFGYQGLPGEPTTTAIGLTLMLYLGESPHHTPFYDALTRLAERGPTLTNIYHDYYATLALHHSRHHYWGPWNQKLRDHLIATQATSGHEAGSWHFEDHYGNTGGRLYTTAMCAMTLEVYYRYLPLYEQVDFPL